MKLTAEDEAWLKDYCQVLAEQFPGLVEQVILYGSKARGTAKPDSDLDLLVVIRKGDRCIKDLVSTPGHMLALTTDVVPAIMVLTADEWESQRKRRAPFWQTVTRDGRRVPSWEGVAAEGDGYRMNPEDVQAEFSRAEQSLRAARLLQGEALFGDAISHNYYAVMHAARAALLFHDTITESHSTVRRLFGQILVRPGLIEKPWADVLAREQDQRIRADYGVGTWEPQTASELVDEAAAFVQRIGEYLRNVGGLGRER
jgi:uncharacterized protein (UPF0332 family)/predicted nucleotidyltransferase